MKNQLEQIANDLLEEKITREEAYLLSKGIKINSSKEKGVPRDSNLIEQEGYLSLVQMGLEIAHIDFHYTETGLGESSIFINYIESTKAGEGNFSRLFNQLIKIGEREGIRILELEVDEDNLNAIEIYEHLGFECVCNVLYCSENASRFQMRKILN